MSPALLLKIFRNRERIFLPFDFLGLATTCSGNDFGTEDSSDLVATGRECGWERKRGGSGGWVGPGVHVTCCLGIESALGVVNSD